MTQVRRFVTLILVLVNALSIIQHSTSDSLHKYYVNPSILDKGHYSFSSKNATFSKKIMCIRMLFNCAHYVVCVCFLFHNCFWFSRWNFFLLVYEILRTINYPKFFGQGSVFMFQGLSLIFCLLLQLHIPGRAYQSKIQRKQHNLYLWYHALKLHLWVSAWVRSIWRSMSEE